MILDFRRRPTAPQTPHIPQVRHDIIRDTGTRLHRESIGRGLSVIDADNVLGLYRAQVPLVGHIRAYDLATRRAITLAGGRQPDPPQAA